MKDGPEAGRLFALDELTNRGRLLLCPSWDVMRRSLVPRGMETAEIIVFIIRALKVPIREFSQVAGCQDFIRMPCRPREGEGSRVFTHGSGGLRKPLGFVFGLLQLFFETLLPTGRLLRDSCIFPAAQHTSLQEQRVKNMAARRLGGLRFLGSHNVKYCKTWDYEQGIFCVFREIAYSAFVMLTFRNFFQKVLREYPGGQKGLAEKTGISASTISRIALGDVHPGLDKLDAIAKALPAGEGLELIRQYLIGAIPDWAQNEVVVEIVAQLDRLKEEPLGERKIDPELDAAISILRRQAEIDPNAREWLIQTAGLLRN